MLPNVIGARTAHQFVVQLCVHAVNGYIIHLFTNGHNLKSWLSAFACSLIGLLNGRKTLLTFGSGNLVDYINRLNVFERMLVRATLSMAGAVACRNDEMLAALQFNGAHRVNSYVVSGFMGVSEDSLGFVPEEFLEFKRSHSPLLGAILNTSPEYGALFLFGVLEALRKEYPQIGLVCIGLTGDDVKKIGYSGETSGYMYLPGDLPHDAALSVIQRVDVFIRCTKFDGDANSVREAMALGVPVVATRTAYRPAGVMTFPIGDVACCVNLVKKALEGGRGKARSNNCEGAKDEVLKLYSKLAGLKVPK